MHNRLDAIAVAERQAVKTDQLTKKGELKVLKTFLELSLSLYILRKVRGSFGGRKCSQPFGIVRKHFLPSRVLTYRNTEPIGRLVSIRKFD